MKYGLNIRPDGALDFLSFGALIHRLDPGIIPFRKASHCDIHVSGGEFNCAANLSDCFRLNTGVATAMVDYPIGDLIAERVRAMGVKPFYKKNGTRAIAANSDRARVGVFAGDWCGVPVVLRRFGGTGNRGKRYRRGWMACRVPSSRAAAAQDVFGKVGLGNRRRVGR